MILSNFKPTPISTKNLGILSPHPSTGTGSLLSGNPIGNALAARAPAPAPVYNEILPPAFNYTPSAQWLNQMAQFDQNPQFSGLLGGQQSFNLQPQRTAPQGGTYRAPAQNGAALAAQYLK